MAPAIVLSNEDSIIEWFQLFKHIPSSITDPWFEVGKLVNLIRFASIVLCQFPTVAGEVVNGCELSFL